MIILQISPEFEPGTGVGGVAAALEARWIGQGHEVRRFGLDEAGCGFLAGARPGLRGRLSHAARVMWFSSVGTVRARRVVRDLPAGAISICHNDALAGDIYVNHGVLTSAMRARGRFVVRMVRNPLHLVTVARDQVRYRAGVHRTVVSLSQADRTTLVQAYGLAEEKAVVIPNGVQLDRFRPASAEERREARISLGLPEQDRVVAFVGHEFDRKGLPLLLGALADLADHHVVVVGGTEREIAAVRANLHEEVAARVRFTGRVPDPRQSLAAADVLALPSAYEANPLVVLEALASGLQVVVTEVGSIPEYLDSDEVSQVVERSAEGVRDGLVALAEQPQDRASIQEEARARAALLSWDVVAEAYLDLFERMLAGPGSPR